MSDTYPMPTLPDGWEPIDYLCYARDGSKAYKGPEGGTAHIINMYDTGRYTIQYETPQGDYIEDRVTGYERAVSLLENILSRKQTAPESGSS